MKTAILFLSSLAIVLCLQVVNISAFSTQNKQRSQTISKLKSRQNKSSVIGLLSFPLASFMKSNSQFEGKTSYVWASYVDWLEKAGAEVVPIPYNLPNEELKTLLKQINGVLFMGGAYDATAFYDSANFIFNQVIEMNNLGTYFPLWGVCLGSRLLAEFAASNRDQVNARHEAVNIKLPLFWIDGVKPQNTKMFGLLGDEAINFQSKDLTHHIHQNGIDPEKFISDQGLRTFYQPTSYSFDVLGHTFVSTFEAINYPIYATAFHPENREGDFSKMYEEYNDYFAEFLVKEAKRNTNAFALKQDENSSLIENYELIEINNMIVYAI